MTSRICILALSVFIHAAILALLPRWDAAARSATPREIPIRVALHAPRSPEPFSGVASPPVADVPPPPEKAVERPEPRNETPVAAQDTEMVRTADPPDPEHERSIEPAPKPLRDIRPAKKTPPRRRTPDRRPASAHASPAPDGRRVRPLPAASVNPASDPASDPASEPANEPASPTNAGGDSGRSVPSNPASGAPGDGAERILSISEASPVRRTPPGYPLASRVRGEEGTAVLVAQVANGRVLSVAVETSSGFDRLDAAARFAVLRWTFASKEPIRVRIPVSFRLTDVK